MNDYNDYLSEGEEQSPKCWAKTISGSEFNSDGTPNMDNVSDGYHTFGELYHHRSILFLGLCMACKDRSWKSKLHSDGTMYDGMFIVGLNTQDGPVTYHFDMKYWDIATQIPEIEKAPEWDGCSPQEGLKRLVKEFL